MINLPIKEYPGDQPNMHFAAKLIIVALAYFVSGRLGLAIPYVDTHITLIWLPTGIALAALMRWGYNCWPGIFLGALATNYMLDSSPLQDISIALGYTLAPMLAAKSLRRFGFHTELDRAYDILLLTASAAGAMLVSASIGVLSLAIYKPISLQQAGADWLSWWAGDFLGVLMAAPLLLNISRTELKKLWAQRLEFLAWFSILLAVSWHVFLFVNVAGSHSAQLVYLLLPSVLWSAMRFGVMGSSLGVLIPAMLAVAATRFGLGPFYTEDDQHGPLLMLLFFSTLVLADLMVAAIQAGRKRAEEAARLENDLSKELIQSLPGIFYMFDASGRFLMWNRQFETVLQLNSEEIARSNPLDFFEGSDRDLIAENIRKVFEHGNTEVDAVLVAKNGARMDYHFTGKCIIRDGETVLVGMGVDITERKKAETAIREAKESIDITFNSSPNAVIISRADGYISDVNDAFTRLTGFTKEDSVGHTVLDLDLWVNLDDRKKYISELQSSGVCENFETQFRRKSGSEFSGSLSARITSIQGIQHIIASISDITERKLSEQKNEVLMRRHQALMKSALEGIHIMDERGNIVEANDTFCNMLGYTQKEMSRLNVADWDAQWTREELMERFRQLILIDGALFETKHRRKDGSVIDVEVSTTGAEIDGKYFLYASSRDITERKLTEKTLEVARAHEAEALQELRVMFNTSGEGFWKATTSGYILDANEAYCRIVGYTKDEVIGAHITKFEGIELRPEDVAGHIQRIMERGTDRFDTKHRHRDGHLIGIEIVTSYIRETDCVIAFMHDVSERKRVEEMLRIAAITFDSQEGIMITDADANILRVNQAFQNITGYSAVEVVGKNPRSFQSGKHDAGFFRDMWSDLLGTGKWAGEVWDKRKDGEIYPKLMTITAVYDDRNRVTNYVAVFRDISNRKKSEQEIHQLAFYDPLTKLPNRRLLMDRLQQGLAISARSYRHGALLFLDMDHFKTINDTQGHAKGDQLLIEVARRLQSCVREGDTVARLGGDEFVVVLEELSGEAQEAATQTELVAEKIRMELDKTYLLDDYEFILTVSIGISLFFNHKEGAEDLLRHADVAMYQAKMAGRNTIRFFDPQMQLALETRAAMEVDLRRALEKQQFHLCYQVQVDSLRRPLGAEVLLRWVHPERGDVSPTQFIPLAEETGLIVPIGLWVLKTACTQLKKWQSDARTRDLVLSVNVSAKQFRQPDFVAQAQLILMESGAKPSHLKMEFTESTVLENVEDTISKMRELKILGVGFSVDDFGTGYSSLQYLKRLPLDQIKIDQSFVRDIVSDPNDAAIVQTIIAMTEALGLNVIAEGVETMAQFEFLDNHGCHAFQGYLFSIPVPIDQFESVLLGDKKSSKHSRALP